MCFLNMDYVLLGLYIYSFNFRYEFYVLYVSYLNIKSRRKVLNAAIIIFFMNSF
jgi:hypothetical protein